MNTNLNMFKEKSKSTFGWNSIKESEHGKDESKGWRTCKTQSSNGFWIGQSWCQEGESPHNTSILSYSP